MKINEIYFFDRVLLSLWGYVSIMVMTLTEKALEMATAAHDGQTYGDVPYINHPMAVSRAVPQTPIMIASALLHDTVEDGGLTFLDIARACGTDVALAVQTLTRAEHETYFEYIGRVADSWNETAKWVKLADLRENIKTAPESLRKRYEKAIAILDGALLQVIA